MDDQPSNLLALEAILAGEGLNLVRALSGEQALHARPGRRLRRHPDGRPDAGHGRLRGGRADPRARPLPAHADPLPDRLPEHRGADPRAATRSGAVDFLSKPIVPAVLRSKVAVFVELFQKNEQVKRQAAPPRREPAPGARARAGRGEAALGDGAAPGGGRRRRSAVAEELAEKADELTRTIDEQVRAEEQLQHRAAQQAIVAGLGQRALPGPTWSSLLCEAAGAVASSLSVESRPGHGAERGRTGFVLRAGTVGEHGNISLARGGCRRSRLARRPCDPGIERAGRCGRYPRRQSLRRPRPCWADRVSISGAERCHHGTAISPFGTLGVFSDLPRTFSQDDVHFLQAVANVLAAAIQRRHDQDALGEVRDELARQLADMTTLHALSERLSNKIELTDVLQEVLSAVVGLHGAERGVLMLHDRDRGLMRTAAVLGLSSELLKHSQTTVTEWNSSNSRISPGNAAGQELGCLSSTKSGPVGSGPLDRRPGGSAQDPLAHPRRRSGRPRGDSTTRSPVLLRAPDSPGGALRPPGRRIHR